MNRSLFICPLVLVVLAACSRPKSYEEFIREKDSVSGMYSFELDMTDSLDIYDVWFYTRVDRSRAATVADYPPMELVVWWVAPSGKVYDETVYMSSGDYRGVREKYRSGIEPSERGVWKLCVKPNDPPKNFRGFGVICERYGTR